MAERTRQGSGGQGALGALELLLSMGSGAVATPLSGLYGLTGLLDDPEEMQKRLEEAQAALTYQPRTEKGQQGLQTLGETMSLLDEPFEALGDAAYDMTGSPLAGALAYSVPQVLGGVAAGKTPLTNAVNKSYVNHMRPRSDVKFTTEVTRTPDRYTQNIDLGNERGVGMLEGQLSLAKPKGSEFSALPHKRGQGVWEADSGDMEYNPNFTQNLGKTDLNVGENAQMTNYMAQVSENLRQDANGMARFVPHRINDLKNANALSVSGVSPAQIKELGSKYRDMVIADRGDGQVIVKGFDDASDMTELARRVKEIDSKAKIKTGRIDNNTDGVFASRNDWGDGTPTYSDYGAMPVEKGLLGF